MTGSALYNTCISHQRLRPKRHRFAYGAAYLLLDLQELDALQGRLRWFSYNRANLFSFFDADHGPGDGTPVRLWLKAQLENAGVVLGDGRIEVLCLPRVLGYVFNPLSVYFCYHGDGHLAAVLYEVTNTFGERHNYLFPLGDGPRQLYAHRCPKHLYVSPFIPLAGHYDFRIAPPDDSLSLNIRHAQGGHTTLLAWMEGRRVALTDGALLASLVRYPLLTLKVVAGIHYEALRLWRKKVPFFSHPQPPKTALTVIHGGHSGRTS